MAEIQTYIIKTLNAEFEPQILHVENESDQHQGPPGRESHFKVYIVSENFKDKNRLQRQRMVFDCLGAVMTRIHALALKVVTPEEHHKNPQIFKSPDCAHKK